MPYIIEFAAPNRRGCFVAICAMGGTVVAVGAVALALLLTGQEWEGVALLAGWILCFPLGTAVFVDYVERKSRFLGKIEIQDDRITIRDDRRRRTIVIDFSTTFDWMSRSIVEGHRKYALRQLHCREVDQEMLWRAIRRIVPADRQTNWEVFAYCRLVPRKLRVSQLPSEAYFLDTRRSQWRRSLIVALVCMVPIAVVAYWAPAQAAVVAVAMLAVNAVAALLQQRTVPREGQHEVRLSWVLRYPGAVWAFVGPAMALAGISMLDDSAGLMGILGPAALAVSGVVVTGVGLGIASEAHQGFVRKVALQVVPTWEVEWLAAHVVSPEAAEPTSPDEVNNA